MKRQLFHTIDIYPGVISPGDITDSATAIAPIDREDYLSAALALTLDVPSGSPTSANMGVTILTGDKEDGSDMEPVEDERAVLAPGIPLTDAGTYTVQLDLIGCKRYIQPRVDIAFEGGTTPSVALVAAALVLGDKNANPV